MSKKYPLSAIDHVFTGVGSYPIEFIFVYKRRIDEKRLEESLKETLKFFPMISSILVSDGPGSYAFELSTNGLLFNVAASSLNFEENEKKYEYIDPVETLEGNPLAKILLTNTPGGSILGVSLSHALADGFSYFHFLSSWAKIFNQKPIFPPVHDREILTALGKAASPEENGSFHELTGLFLEEERIPIPKNKLNWETRKYSLEQMKEMMYGVQQETEIRLSHNDLITSLLAKEYLLDWSLDNGSVRCFINCPVDFRRLLEGFPKTYFGNAVAMASLELPVASLEEIKVPELAEKIRRSISGVDSGFVNRSIRALESEKENKGRKIFERVHVMHPIEGLLVTNLSRLPVQEIEFDAGPPVQYDILTQTVRGAVVLPSSTGYEARVCCPIHD